MHSPPPSCDVIIPVKNQVAWTRLCLEELFGHTDASELGTVLLVDDGSSDASWARLEALAARFEKVKLVRNGDRAGFGGANNFGARMLDAPYMLLLNSDCLVTAGTVRKLIGACRADDRIGMACPLSNESATLSVPMLPGCSYHDMNRLLEEATAGAPREQTALDACTVVGNCLLITRNCWAAVGEFDLVWGQGYGEETDYQFRAMARGFRCVALVDTYVYHQGGATFRHEPGWLALREKATNLFFERWGREYESYARRCRQRDPATTAARLLASRGARAPRHDVLFVLPGIHQSIGGAHVVLDLVNHLVRRGMSAACTVLAPGDPLAKNPYAEPIFAGIHAHPDSRSLLLDDELEAGVVVATLFTTSAPAFLFAWQRGIPMVNFLQGYEVLFSAGTVREEVLDAYVLADHGVVTSRWLESSIGRHAPGGGITRLPIGVNGDIFFPDPNARESGVLPRVAVVIRSAADKGQAVLLEMLDRLLDHRDELCVTVLLAKEYRVPRGWLSEPGTCIVELPITQEELAAELRRVDVLVDASLHEGFGLMPLEAMASGATVVVSDSGGIADFVRDGENGIVIAPVNQPGAFADAVLGLIRDRGRLARMQAAATESAAEFPFEGSGDRYAEFFRAVASRPNGRKGRSLAAVGAVPGASGLEPIRDVAVVDRGAMVVHSRNRAVEILLPGLEASPETPLHVRLELISRSAAALEVFPSIARRGPGKFWFVMGRNPARAFRKAVRIVLGRMGPTVMLAGARAALAERLRAADSLLTRFILRDPREMIERGHNVIEIHVPPRDENGAPRLLMKGLPRRIVLATVHAGAAGAPAAQQFAPGADPRQFALGRRNAHQLSPRLVLQSFGRDPGVLLPDFEELGDSDLAIMLDVESPSATLLQVYYATRRSPGFDEARSVVRPLACGRNVLVIVLRDMELEGPLRLDPGTTPGDFVVNRLEVRSLPRGTRGTHCPQSA